jgi:FkbM family methyltransferase
MMDSLWLHLRNSSVGRRLRAYPWIARPIHALACRLLPSTCRVRSGPCAGLWLEPAPSWPTDLWEGGYEPEVQAIVNALLGPGAVFYDVGGGAGLFSLLAARKGARVLVFEPHPVNAECIARQARMNALENSIQVVPLAAHSVCGHLEMEIAQHGSQLAAPGYGESRRSKRLKIPCVTLDEFSRSNPPPTLMKVDVEGGEFEVLKGSLRLFEQAGPRLICETHSRENARLIWEWLAARGYSMRWLEPPGHEHHLFAEPTAPRRAD